MSTWALPPLARASRLYGAIGVTVVVFILGRAIVLAVSVNAVVFERFGSITQVVFRLPGLRVLPRRSKRARRLLGLDADDGRGRGGRGSPPGSP